MRLFPGPRPLLNQFAEIIENRIAAGQFSTFSLGRSTFELGLEAPEAFFPLLLLAFQQPESFSNYLAGGLIPAGFHAAPKKRAEFRRERYIYGGPGGHTRGIPQCAKLRHRVTLGQVHRRDPRFAPSRKRVERELLRDLRRRDRFREGQRAQALQRFEVVGRARENM